MSAARLLLAILSRSSAESVVDVYMKVPLDWAEQRQRGEVEQDHVYVWWAKLRSGNRQQPPLRRREVLALHRWVGDAIETHLSLK